MPNRLVINRLDRITLVTKGGRFTAAHPELRDGVVEVVKAGGDDWYDDFWRFITRTPDDDIPADWIAAFSETVEKAKANNYPASRGPFAGPHNSFPIKTQQDVYDAARLVGHAADKAAVKARIIRIARSKGFSLPKSWTNKVKKADFFAVFKAWVAGDESDVFEPEDGEDIEKAKANTMHSHDHAHVSSYGYSYSHNHAHDHMDGCAPDSDEHGTSETAHAHAHVSKAGEADVNFDEMVANLQGLKEEVDAIKASLSKAEEDKADAQSAMADAVKKAEEAEAARSAAVAESVAKDADVAKAKAEAEEAKQKLVDASRQPMTAAPDVKKAKKNMSDMSFDEALHLALHGEN